MDSINLGNVIRSLAASLKSSPVKDSIQPKNNFGVNISEEINIKTIASSNNSVNINTNELIEQIRNMPLEITQKALIEAGIEQNDLSMAAVRELIKNNMPLTEVNINKLLSNINIYGKDASIELLALMQRLEIGVTRENITLFSNFLDGVNDLTGNIEEMIEKLSEKAVSIFTQNKPAENDDNSTVYSKMASAESEITNNEINRITKDIQSDPIKSGSIPRKLISGVEIEKFITVLKSSGAPEKLIESVQSYFSNDAEVQTDATDLLSKLRNHIQNLNNKGSVRKDNHFTGNSEVPVFNQETKEILGNDGYKKLLRDALENRWMIKPEDLINGKADKKLTRLRSELIELEKIMSESFNLINNGENEADKSVKNVIKNLNFLDKLSNNLIYYQLPLLFNDKTADGDLYVFADKRKIKKLNVNNVNILLKLEFDNIGSLDIYLNIHEKNINSRFYADDESILPFISENIPELTISLENLGYSLQHTVETPEREFDVLSDFINKDLPVNNFKSLSLYIKA